MIAKTFSSDGALGKAIPGFQARQPQIDMAEAVSSAIKDQTQLVVEAGTGTGKTFAYLVPALLSGKKVIISTGSKNLQEQLYHRDLPLMVNALGFYGQVALLKGRSNYLCLDRLSRQMVESHTNESDPTLLTQLVKVRTWSSETKIGDLGDCDDLPEDSMIIPTITSTNDNCLGKECPSYTDCFVLKARKRAMDSDIVVVNHHLFLADLAIKETGFGELIPEADVFIFDEAHQLPDTASLFFGESVSTTQLLDLARDSRMEGIAGAKDFAALPEAALALEKAARDLRLSRAEDNGRLTHKEIIGDGDFTGALDNACAKLSALYVLLESQAERSEGLELCRARAQALAQTISRWREAKDDSFVRWIELFGHSLQLHATPL